MTVIATRQGKQSRQTAGEGAVRMIIQVLHIPQVNNQKAKEFIGLRSLQSAMKC